MNKIKEIFLQASVKEQEDFCKDMHRVICRIVANNVDNSWCGRVLLLWKEKVPEKFEEMKKK